MDRKVTAHSIFRTILNVVEKKERRLWSTVLLPWLIDIAGSKYNALQTEH
jgi:hypothetical protein